jgi:transporter family-2 protein
LDLIPAHLLPLLLALVSGVLMAVQGSLNTAMAKVVGLWEATFVVHITGTLLLIVILFALKGGVGGLGMLPTAPWYAYLGGVAGVFIIYLVAASIPSIGVANATTAIIVGQVLTAVLIDHFGAFGLTRTPCGVNQLAGLVLLAVGAKLLLK